MRVALHSILRDGQEFAYEADHKQIPADLLASLQRAGIRDWVIWRSGRDLFHLVDCDDFEAAMRTLADDPVDRRWQETMSVHVERFAENPDGAAGMSLRQVWTMAGQASGGGDERR